MIVLRGIQGAMLKGKRQPTQGGVDGFSPRTRSLGYTSVTTGIEFPGHGGFPCSTRKRGNQLLSCRGIVDLVEVKYSAFCPLDLPQEKVTTEVQTTCRQWTFLACKDLCGSGGGIRTPDTRIMIPLLSPLSYPAREEAWLTREHRRQSSPRMPPSLTDGQHHPSYGATKLPLLSSRFPAGESAKGA